MPSLGNIGLKLAEFVVGLDSIVTVTHTLSKTAYRIYSNKRRGAYLIFHAISAALIQGWRLLNNVPDKFTFSIFLFNSTLFIC